MQNDEDDDLGDVIPGTDGTTIRWFGWVHPAYLDERTRVETPVGQRCLGGCGEDIAADDIGITIPDASSGVRHPWHRDCFLRMVDPTHVARTHS